jgi:uncharacterized repeat protein (TIGR01451 family)
MPNDYFGKSVAYDDHTIAVGASYADIGGNPNQGEAYVYHLEAAQDLSISKEVTPALVNYHGVVTYTVTMSNSGLVDDPNVLFTDALPVEVDFGNWIVQPAGAIEDNDTITWTGAIAAGQAITLSFTAVHVGERGDVVTNVAVATGVSTVSDTATFTVEPGYSLAVTLAGTGGGSVASTPPGIACGSDCSEVYDDGTLVALTASPAISSTFAGWSGACTGLGACTVTMTETKHVTTTFDASLLFGTFQAEKVGMYITFTVVITSPTPQSNVVVTGSIPANTYFSRVTNGSHVPEGGDYGRGYVSTGVVPSLLPGERITLTWTVYMPFYALGYISNQAHARAETASNVLHFWHQFYRVMMPLIYRDTPAYP